MTDQYALRASIQVAIFFESRKVSEAVESKAIRFHPGFMVPGFTFCGAENLIFSHLCWFCRFFELQYP